MAKPKDKKRTKAEIASAKRVLAANAPKRGRKKGTKRGKKKSPGPTKFQRFMLRDPEGAKKKMGWT